MEFIASLENYTEKRLSFSYFFKNLFLNVHLSAG